MKTSLQKRTKCESPKEVYKATKTQPAVTEREENRFKGMSENLVKAEPLVYPVSKLKTTDYLMKYKGIDVSVYSIYRYLDKLHQEQIDLVKEISFAHTLGVLGANYQSFSTM